MNEARRQLVYEVVRRNARGESGRGIARSLGIAPRTVKKILAREDLRRTEGESALPARRPPRVSKLDVFDDQVAAWLEQYPNLTATRLLEKLAGEGFTGGYTNGAKPTVFAPASPVLSYPCEMSTTKPSAKPPTLADLDALPPGVVGEIIEGVLYTMTKPRSRHRRTGTGIGGDLRGPFDLGRGGPGGWWIIVEPGIELPNDTKEISPDVAGWRRERMPELPADDPLRIVPDWVCEILSKTTRRHDQLVKLPYYAKVGVAYAWVVDLEACVLTAYRLEGGAWRVIGAYSDETEARIEPFDVVPLNVADWWPPSALDGPTP